jgi:predicted O-linked N-acetylglucosamine transferase (SPINDLY family)
MSTDERLPPSAAATLEEACANAMNLQIAGHPDLAERLYRSILAAQPGHAAANHGLGLVLIRMQRPADGLPHLLAAIEAKPQIPDYWLGYLEGLRLNGDLAAAAAALALGRQHGLSGQSVEEFAQRLQAETERQHKLQRESSAAEPREATLRRLVAGAEFSAALPVARSLTERFPERGLGWKVLGALLGEKEQTQEAVAAMKTAIRLLPNDAEALTNLAVVTSNQLQQRAEAEALLRKAIDLDQGFQPAYIELGDVLVIQGRYGDAEHSYRQAIDMPPDRSHLNNNFLERYSSWVFVMSHNPRVDPDTLFEAHRQAGACIESRAIPAKRHANPPDPARTLKVGFVSADLCDHSVANFIEPLLSHLSGRTDLELHAYYNNKIQDQVTLRLHRHLPRWHPVHGLSDADVAKQIQTDAIDLIVDLSGHTAMNRLGALAYKPAPVQVSWIGYPGTTGLRAMDYYLADRHFLPPGRFDGQFLEKLVYLPAAAGFEPHPGAPAVGPLPALKENFITFGSFNRLGKINDATTRLWAELLRAVPNSILLIAGSARGGRLDEILDLLAAEGVARERLAVYPRTTMNQYLAMHNEVDICLDTLPYSGATTTNHALWMGVPTLTLAGPTPASRQSAANLAHLGLEGFTAVDCADFVAKGVYWSRQVEELAGIRAGMRERWRRSRSRSAEAVAHSVHRALREMWRRWCAGEAPASFEICGDGSIR